MSNANIKKIRNAVKDLNTKLKDNIISVKITPVDVEKNFVKMNAKFDSKGKLKINWIKVKIGGKSVKLTTKQYQIISKDKVAKTVTISGKGKNFTGAKTIQL